MNKSLAEFVNQLDSYRSSSRAELQAFVEFLAGNHPDLYAALKQGIDDYEAGIQRTIRFDELDWGNPKGSLSYDKSLERLRQAGYERHPRPSEVFGLLIDYLECTLNDKLQTVAENMIESCSGEWLSMAVERQGNLLVFYTDPENIVWDGQKQMDVSLNYSAKHEFEHRPRPWRQCDNYEEMNLKRLDDDLVRFIYTRPYRDLPRQIKNAKIKLPSEGLAPLYIENYKVNCFYSIAMSRGCRRAKVKNG
jgi:hypothetical protein